MANVAFGRTHYTEEAAHALTVYVEDHFFCCDVLYATFVTILKLSLYVQNISVDRLDPLVTVRLRGEA